MFAKHWLNTNSNSPFDAVKRSATSFCLPEEQKQMSSPLPSHVSSPNAHLPTTARSLAYMQQPLDLTYAYIPLLICCFISGLADAAAFNAWSTFVSMQTGNTIFLALGASRQPKTPLYTWLKSMTAIVFFFTGCLAFSRLMRALGHVGKSRLALAGCFSIQAGLMIIAAGLVQGQLIPVPKGTVTPVEAAPENPRFIELVTIGLLAFQAGGQIITSRLLGFSEIPTTVLTSSYCDIANDPRLFKGGNRPRDRRVTSVVCLLVGGVCGGWLSRSSGGMAAVLWIGSGLKVGITIAWLLWKRAIDDGK